MNGQENNRSAMISPVCLVCVDPLKAAVFGECSHKSICSKCFSINKMFYEKNECIVCKIKLDRIVVTTNLSLDYSEGIFNTLLFSKRLGMYFENKMLLRETENLFSTRCPVCDEEMSGISKLKQHVQDKHRKSFCITCLHKRKVFMHQQRVYSEIELRRHLREGDPPVDNEGPIEVHTRCKLCRVWCFDRDDYQNHMIQSHHCCQICRRLRDSQARSNETWLLDMNQLLEHYRESHFTCAHPDCASNPIENVFDSSISLQAHVLKEHSSQTDKQSKRSAQRLVIDFKYSRNEESSRSESGAEVDRGRRGPPRPARQPGPPSDSRPTAVQVSDHLPSLQEAYSLSSSSENVNSNSPADDNAAANRNVLSEIKRVVGEDGFIHFRQVSAQFFHEEISAEQYYVEFCRLFKKDAGAGSMWMSLVCTLPQYHLRERLYQIHYRAVREGGGFNINHAEVNILLNKTPANASDNSGGESEQSGRRAGEEADRRGGLSGSGQSRGASRGERGSEKRSMRRGKGDELQRGGAGSSRPALNEERCAGDSSAVHTAEVSRETTLHAAGLRLEMELMMSFLSSLERCVQRQLAKSYRSGGAEITSEVDPGAAESEIAQVCFPTPLRT